MPKWLAPVVAAVLGIGGGGAGISGLDLFGAEAREKEREAFLSQIIFCNEIRTESREVALKMIETQRLECRDEKAALRALIAR